MASVITMFENPPSQTVTESNFFSGWQSTATLPQPGLLLLRAKHLLTGLSCVFISFEALAHIFVSTIFSHLRLLLIVLVIFFPI